MISETRERLSDTAIVTVGDTEHMPFESEQFQVVTCNMSIHHYPHAYTLTDERRIPVILDTDDRDKAARYEHLGMKLDRVRSCGERVPDASGGYGRQGSYTLITDVYAAVIA